MLKLDPFFLILALSLRTARLLLTLMDVSFGTFSLIS